MNEPPPTDPPPILGISPRAFLLALEKHRGNATDACAELGIDGSKVFAHRDSDEEFREDWDAIVHSFTKEARDRFLAELKRSGIVVSACQSSGIPLETAYRLRHADPGFSHEWSTAERSWERLARKRAMKAAHGKAPADGPEQRAAKQNADDIALVERAIKRIEAVPPWDIPAGSLGKRVGLHAALKEEFRPIWARLEELYAQLLPEAAGPSSPACTAIGHSSGTPVTNLLHCHDLCPHCVEPAKRSLRQILAALTTSGKTVEPVGLPQIRTDNGRRRRVARSPARPGMIYANDARKKYELAPSTFQGYLTRIEKKNKDDVGKDKDSGQRYVREDALRALLRLPSTR